MARYLTPVTLALCLLALAVSPAAADEVVHFKNGTFMVVRSHAVEGNMLRVQLGPSAYIAFPLALVERIDTGREVVSAASLERSGANRVVSSEAAEGETPTSAARRAAAAPGPGSRRGGGSAAGRAGSGASPVAIGNLAWRVEEPRGTGSGSQRSAKGPLRGRRRLMSLADVYVGDPSGHQVLDATGKLPKRKPMTVQLKPVPVSAPPEGGAGDSKGSSPSGAGESGSGE